MVCISGVAAGAFDAALWTTGTLNWVPDICRPLLAPAPGKSRNIYAPSVLHAFPSGYRVFYGGWDGIPTGNDHIYSITTSDFRSFSNRRVEIKPGAFQHICNVSAARLDDQRFGLMCTVYPDAKGLNKPAFFAGNDEKWNNRTIPATAVNDDIVTIAEYANYPAADINGMNVLLKEDNAFRLYFCDFADFGKVYRASGSDGRTFSLDGVCVEARMMVNDVKRFPLSNRSCYLMGLHRNEDSLYYSLSSDGMKFSQPRQLFSSLDKSEAFIVSLGWVTTASADGKSDSVAGVLYGAGASPHLAENRIFARWLQKKVVLVSDQAELTAAGGVGLDRQVFRIPGNTVRAHLEIFSEDGTTRVGKTELQDFVAGTEYRLGRNTNAKGYREFEVTTAGLFIAPSSQSASVTNQ